MTRLTALIILILSCAFNLNAQQTSPQRKVSTVKIHMDDIPKMGNEANGAQYYLFDYRFHTDNYNYAKEIDQSGNNYTIICSIWNDPLCKQPLVAKGKTKDTATPYYFITRNVVKLLADKFYLKFPVNDLSNNLTEMYGGNYVGGKKLYYKIQIFKERVRNWEESLQFKPYISYVPKRKSDGEWSLGMLYQYLYIIPNTEFVDYYQAHYNIFPSSDQRLDKLPGGFVAKVSLWHDKKKTHPVLFYQSKKKTDNAGEYLRYPLYDGEPKNDEVIKTNIIDRKYDKWEDYLSEHITSTMANSDWEIRYLEWGKFDPSNHAKRDSIYAYVELFDKNDKKFNESIPYSRRFRLQPTRHIKSKNNPSKNPHDEEENDTIQSPESENIDGPCSHYLYTRTKSNIIEKKRTISQNQCVIKEDVEYKEKQECYLCHKELPQKQESDSQLFDNPEAPETCITEYCSVVPDYKTEGNKFITIKKIFVENSEGDRHLAETRTRADGNNRSEHCPLHNMEKIGDNLYQCKKCKITRYGNEEKFQLAKNKHAVIAPKCPSETISKTINGVNFVFHKAMDEKKQKAIYVGETEVTEAMWMAVFPNHRYDLNKTSKAAIDAIPYEDAKMFISMLNYKSKKEGWKLKFFLPTIEEWVMAYHAGGKSNDAWLSHNSCKISRQVGLKPANDLHVYDMKGNVAEMCDEVLSLPENDGTYNQEYLTSYEEGRRNHYNAYAGNSFLDDINVVGPTDVRIMNISIGREGIGFRVFAAPTE